MANLMTNLENTAIKKYFWILIVVLIFVVDRITKTLVMHYLPFEQPVPIIPSFSLFFTFNSGAAFSFLKSANGWQEWLFGGIAVLVSIIVTIWLFKIHNQNYWLKIALALILGGTLGNLFDRIIFFQVIDFIEVFYGKWYFPAFNIADSSICAGAIMLVVDIACKGKVLKT